MTFFLSGQSVLKWLETPSVYIPSNDELYELDQESFEFLRRCASAEGCMSVDTEFTDYCLAEGILTTDATDACHPPIVKSPNPSLRYLELQITDRCNLRCHHCYIGDTGTKELDADRIHDVLREFEKMQGLRVLLTGGEPLLHSRFEEINESLPDFKIRKVLFTNSVQLSDTILRSLNVEEIQISIDGLEAAHDALRGPGTFSRAVEAVKRSRDSGIDVSVATMVHAKNLEDFRGMEDMFRGLGIRDWTVDVPCSAGRLKENNSFMVSPGIGGRYLGYGFGGGIHGSSEGYACGLHLMSVAADGRAAKCTFYSDRPVGLIGEGLRQCWDRIRPVRLKELTCNCGHLEACRGGCRFRAELAEGPLGRDLYKCALYDIIV